MSDLHVTPGQSASAPGNKAREILTIALSLTVVCAVGAGLLGVTAALTDRARKAAQERTEHEALGSLLDLAPGDRLVAIEQAYRPDARVVVYTLPAEGGGATRTVAFDLAGQRVTSLPAAAAPARPLGRLFVAERQGRVHGFVVEGETQGYKNKIRFLVGIDDSMTVTGVRVIEHEEDPGLGAEVARPWFDGQYIGRHATDPGAFTVTKDPMPEDWRTALATLDRVAPAEWRRDHAARVAQENAHPLYAVTGATISSRALTDGVRGTLSHFQRRWELLAPALAETTP